MPTHEERRLKHLEQRVYGASVPGDFTYRDRVTVDWLTTLSEDDFELVGEVVEHWHETGELPALLPARKARYKELDCEVRQYLWDRGIREAN